MIKAERINGEIFVDACGKMDDMLTEMTAVAASIRKMILDYGDEDDVEFIRDIMFERLEMAMDGTLDPLEVLRGEEE